MSLKHHWKCSMNYIFLDIDGVMNNQTDWLNKAKNNLEEFQGHRMFCDKAWELLSNVCATTNARVVLSSSWRLGLTSTKEGFISRHSDDHSSGKLLTYFKKYHIELVGLTPSYYDNRGTQITTYVENYLKPTDNWVVLDDEDSDMYGIPKEKIIKTEFETGLLPEHCERIVNYFKGE